MPKALTLTDLLMLRGCFTSFGLEGLEGLEGLDASRPDGGADGGGDAGSPPPTQECVCCGGALGTWPADVPCAIGACDSSCLPRCEATNIEVLEVSIRNNGTSWLVGVPNERCACEGDIECWAEVIDDHVVRLRVERCGAPDTRAP